MTDAAGKTGTLRAALNTGRFAFTAEMTPPDGASADAVLARADCFAGLADAVNVTDGAGARTHMSALPAAAILARAGIEPILQMTVRDRNRLALQGDLIGAAALGIPNILCLRGDDVGAGDQPDAQAVYDLESRDLIATAKTMRNAATLPGGRRLDPAPDLLIGAADTPFDPPPDWQPNGLAAKIEAGADFVQTQFCFDLQLLRRYLRRLADHGLPERVGILVGIGPIASARSARWMNDNLFGVDIPEFIVRRLDGAPDQAAEGKRICLELIDELRGIDGVAGVHLMAPRGEQAIAEMLALAGDHGGRRASA